MAGDGETGVTIIRVTAELDSGPIALQEAVAISAEDDHGSLSARLAELGGELIVRALDLRAAGELELTDQDDSTATYAEKIAPAERRLDPARPAIELERTVRALTPHIGAYLELEGGERLGVLAATAEPGAVRRRRPGRRPTASCSAAADGALRLHRGSTRRGPGDGRRRLPARPQPAAAGVSTPETSAGATPARRAAYEVVRRTFEDEAWADRAFASAAGRLELAGRELAQARRLAYGAVQRRGTSDHVIGALARPPARAHRPGGARGAAPGPVRGPLLRRDGRPRRGRPGGRAGQGGAPPRSQRTGPHPRRGGVRQRGPAARRRRARGAARRARRFDPGGRGDRAFLSRVAGADVVGGARRRPRHDC